MVYHVRRSAVVGAVAAATVVLGTGCATGGASGPASAGNSAAPPTAAASASAAAPHTGTVAGCDSAPWQSTPVTVTHTVAVPPVPVVAAVRAAQHPECGYDRLVLDITGSMPGYSVRYVAEVTADASGRPIALPGQRFLLITLRSAQAHSDAGAPTVSRQVHLPGYPTLRSWILAGDDEGVVTIAVGLPGQVSVRAGELPGHLYVDFRE